MFYVESAYSKNILKKCKTCNSLAQRLRRRLDPARPKLTELMQTSLDSKEIAICAFFFSNAKVMRDDKLFYSKFVILLIK